MKFLSPGIPLSTPPPGDLLAGLRRAAELGISGMELEFVRGIWMTEEQARAVKKLARELGLALTAHAPFFVNLNSQEPEKVVASRKRILDSARMAMLAGAEKVTFHAAWRHGQPGEKVFLRVAEEMRSLVKQAKKEKLAVELAPETAGKKSQFGALPELLRIAKEVPGARICFDFAHLAASSAGEENSPEAFRGWLDAIEKTLGKSALKKLYGHISGIEWTPAGERKHHPFLSPENLFDWRGCLRVLKECGCDGALVVESPILEEDILLAKKTWAEL